jgi:hypothetical protein
MSTDLIPSATGAIINQPGSEDPFEVAFSPAKPCLGAVIEMWKPLTWLDRRRRSRMDLFDPEQASELIDLILPPGHRIAKSGALFLEAEEISAPEGWIHVAVGLMLQEANANVSDPYRCGVVDGAYRDPNVWGHYDPGFSAAVVARSIRDARLQGALPSTGGFLKLCIKHRSWFKARHADTLTLLNIRYAAEDALDEMGVKRLDYDDPEDEVPFGGARA